MSFSYTVSDRLSDNDEANDSPEATLRFTVTPDNDMPTDITISGSFVLAAIRDFERIAVNLAGAAANNNEGHFQTTLGLLQPAIDRLHSLQIGRRNSDDTPGNDLVDVGEVSVIDALLAAAETVKQSGTTAPNTAFTAYTDENSPIRTAFEHAVREAVAAKLAEAFIITTSITTSTGGETTYHDSQGESALGGGRITVADVETSALARIQALNVAKKEVDAHFGGVQAGDLGTAISDLALMRDFQDALDVLRGSANADFASGLVTAGAGIIARLDETYDSATFKTQYRAPVATEISDLRAALNGIANNREVMQHFVAVDDAFAALSGADGTTIVAHLQAFASAVQSLAANDDVGGAVNRAEDLVTAATEMVRNLINTDIATSRQAYDAALGRWIEAATDPDNTVSPVTLSGPDAVRFYVTLLVEPPIAGNNPLDNRYHWRLELRPGQEKAPGETYKVTLTYADADARDGHGTVEETFVLVQGVSRSGRVYLQPVGSNDQDFSQEVDPLRPNLGGPTLLEDADRGSQREALIGADDNIAANNIRITGGLPVGGVYRLPDPGQSITGQIINVPLGDVSLSPENAVTVRFATKDADDNVPATVAVEGRVITVTMEIGATAAEVQTALRNVLTTDLDLAQVLHSDGLTINVRAGAGDGTPAAVVASADGNTISITLRGNAVTVADATDLGSDNTVPAARQMPQGPKTVTIGGGEITLADGTSFRFETTTLTLYEDVNENGLIDADERGVKTIYVFRSTDGATVEMRVTNGSLNAEGLATLAGTGGEAEGAMSMSLPRWRQTEPSSRIWRPRQGSGPSGPRV